MKDSPRFRIEGEDISGRAHAGLALGSLLACALAFWIAAKLLRLL
jgi:hypothetical protein